MIKVSVDVQRCDANGTCAALMTDVFEIDQAGVLEHRLSEVEEDREDEPRGSHRVLTDGSDHAIMTALSQLPESR